MIHFDATITLGSIIHALIVCTFIAWLYSRVPAWARSIEDKLDRFMKELQKP